MTAQEFRKIVQTHCEKLDIQDFCVDMPEVRNGRIVIRVQRVEPEEGVKETFEISVKKVGP
jgi:hypothetical protein